jgi:hypothetical protein
MAKDEDEHSNHVSLTETKNEHSASAVFSKYLSPIL